MATISHPQDWPAWVRGVKSALAFYDVTDNGKKRGFLLASCGTAVMSLAERLLSPTDLDSCTFDQNVTAVQNYYAPKPTELTCRVTVYTRNQQGRETAAEFLVELRHLATDCNFGAHLDDALRDHFVVGLREEKLRRRIMEKEKCDLKEALATAIAWERRVPKAT